MEGLNFQFILSVYILIFLFGVPTNLLSFYAFYMKVQSRPTITYILLLNLSVSDLLLLFVLPLKMQEAYFRLRWRLPNILCPITAFLFFCTIYTSSLLLMSVSVDRYLCVAFPVRYRLLRKPVYAVAASIICWVIGMAHCSMIFIVETMPKFSEICYTVCYGNFTEKQLDILLPVRLEFFVVFFLIPLLICTFCYLNCICILYAQPRICRKKKQKSIGMALGTLLVFVICFLPFHISHVVGYMQGRSPEWRSYTVLLTAFNTCVDPIIFYFSSSTLQSMVQYSAYRIFKSRNADLQPPEFRRKASICSFEEKVEQVCSQINSRSYIAT